MLNNGPTATAQMARDTMFQRHEKSCYDRIVHAITSLCLRRQGIAKSEVVCMFSTLQNLEHTIRTAYGDSEETYGGDLWVILPMQGVYQGNGAGPLIWAVVSYRHTNRHHYCNC
jgi:hypothetical protein